MKETPVTDEGLRAYDHLDPAEATLRAWMVPGPHPEHHAKMRELVRAEMPVLARALDRMVGDRMVGEWAGRQV